MERLIISWMMNDEDQKKEGEEDEKDKNKDR